jgi:hypothetical protein
MKCPHCLENFNDEQTWWSLALGTDVDGTWILARRTCPTCRRMIFNLENGPPQQVTQGSQNVRIGVVSRNIQAWPKGIARAKLPGGVIPPDIADDYREACLVLADSPKASAALSRRCLQSLLRNAAGIKHGDLYDEIQQVLDSKQLRGTIADSLDAVRVIGNFAAHPIKSKVTGEIVNVEPHEAEWNLDVLELLFDFYFVQPALAEKRKAALNQKLKEAGKQELP